MQVKMHIRGRLLLRLEELSLRQVTEHYTTLKERTALANLLHAVQ